MYLIDFATSYVSGLTSSITFSPFNTLLKLSKWTVLPIATLSGISFIHQFAIKKLKDSWSDISPSTPFPRRIVAIILFYQLALTTGGIGFILGVSSAQTLTTIALAGVSCAMSEMEKRKKNNLAEVQEVLKNHLGKKKVNQTPIVFDNSYQFIWDNLKTKKKKFAFLSHTDLEAISIANSKKVAANLGKIPITYRSLKRFLGLNNNGLLFHEEMAIYQQFLQLRNKFSLFLPSSAFDARTKFHFAELQPHLENYLSLNPPSKNFSKEFVFSNLSAIYIPFFIGDSWSLLKLDFVNLKSHYFSIKSKNLTSTGNKLIAKEIIAKTKDIIEQNFISKAKEILIAKYKYLVDNELLPALIKSLQKSTDPEGEINSVFHVLQSFFTRMDTYYQRSISPKIEELEINFKCSPHLIAETINAKVKKHASENILKLEVSIKDPVFKTTLPDLLDRLGPKLEEDLGSGGSRSQLNLKVMTWVKEFKNSFSKNLTNSSVFTVESLEKDLNIFVLQFKRKSQIPEEVFKSLDSFRELLVSRKPEPTVFSKSQWSPFEGLCDFLAHKLMKLSEKMIEFHSFPDYVDAQNSGFYTCQLMAYQVDKREIDFNFKEFGVVRQAMVAEIMQDTLS